MKGIVTGATTEGVEELKKSTIKVVNTSLGGTNPENGAKVLAAGSNAGGNAGLEAAAIVSSVRGEEMLAAIVKSGEDKAKAITANAGVNTSALEFAVGGSTAANLAQDAALASAVSGGIALRSLVKDGKLASHSGNDNKGVEIAGISATNKLLGAIDDIIKETVKKVFDKVKKEVNNAKK